MGMNARTYLQARIFFERDQADNLFSEAHLERLWQQLPQEQKQVYLDRATAKIKQE